MPTPEAVGYVEPNLAFWKHLKEMLELNKNMLSESGFLTDELLERNERLDEMVEFCIQGVDM